MRKRSRGFVVCTSIFLTSSCHLLRSGSSTESQTAQSPQLVFLETTDLHSNVMSYDYYKDAPTDAYGLDKVSTLINQARKVYPDAILLDAGDMIQGSILSDFEAKYKNPMPAGQMPAIIKAMNQMHYDAAAIGNHDFNYGLPYMLAAVKGANFPILNTNVLYPTNPPKFVLQPYTMIKRTVMGENVNIAIVGFAPPQILTWDKNNLQGKVIATGIAQSAAQVVPQIKAAGADVIIALAHSGINPVDCDENAGYCLAKIDGIDAVFTGHAHNQFPGKLFAGQNINGIDNAKGTLFGKPAVMAGFWGSHLGVVHLNLQKKNGHWAAAGGDSSLVAVTGVAPDAAIGAAIATEHQQTLNYLRTPIVNLNARLETYFARMRQSAAVDLPNAALIWYFNKVKSAIPNAAAYARLPVLAAGSPSKTGYAGAADYTDSLPGPFAIKNISDVYQFPNILTPVVITGAQLKEWLENAANNFNQMTPALTGEAELLSARYPAFNFDTISGKGLTYRYDISQPAGSRVVDLNYLGQPVPAAMNFIIVASNYRAAGGAGFPVGIPVDIQQQMDVRDVISMYLKSPDFQGVNFEKSWSLKSIPGLQCKVVYYSSEVGNQVLPSHVQLVSTDPTTHMSKFYVDMASIGD